MLKVFICFLGLGTAYYAHGAYTFSEGSVERWIADHEVREMSGNESACDDYADDVEVSVLAETAKGQWEVEGGKDEICGYIKQTAAVFTVLQARGQITHDDVSVERSGFPWRSAVVRYTQRTEIHARNVPPFVSTDEVELTLKRTFGGLKIVQLHATGEMASP